MIQEHNRVRIGRDTKELADQGNLGEEANHRP